jgi:DnaA-homolog protein
MQQLILHLSQALAPTLENFVPGSNGEVLAVLHAWLAGAVEERCVYLWGSAGCGKSHLLRAAAQSPQRLGRALLCASARELESLDQPEPLPPVIAVDDVQQLSAPAQAALFRLFQRLHEDDARVLAAGDAAPAGLDLRDDVRTRLGAGLVFQLRLLSDEEKGEALRSHARGRGFTIAPELTDYLLRHGRRDLPSLLAVLDALDQYSLQTKRPITLPLLRELLAAA